MIPFSKLINHNNTRSQTRHRVTIAWGQWSGNWARTSRSTYACTGWPPNVRPGPPASCAVCRPCRSSIWPRSAVLVIPVILTIWKAVLKPSSPCGKLQRETDSAFSNQFCFPPYFPQGYYIPYILLNLFAKGFKIFFVLLFVVNPVGFLFSTSLF